MLSRVLLLLIHRFWFWCGSCVLLFFFVGLCYSSFVNVLCCLSLLWFVIIFKVIIFIVFSFFLLFLVFWLFLFFIIVTLFYCSCCYCCRFIAFLSFIIANNIIHTFTFVFSDVVPIRFIVVIVVIFVVVAAVDRRVIMHVLFPATLGNSLASKRWLSIHGRSTLSISPAMFSRPYNSCLLPSFHAFVWCYCAAVIVVFVPVRMTSLHALCPCVLNIPWWYSWVWFMCIYILW